MGVPVIATVSEKRIWVEKTISSLDQGFDKKKLLESADAFEDPELRSLIATSITASMAKRKLEQYFERLGSVDGAVDGAQASPESSTPDVHEPLEDTQPEESRAEPAAPMLSDPAGSSDERPARKPLPTRFEAIRDPAVNAPSVPVSEPASAARSSERFDRLEKTVLATKSKRDLTVPDISEDMIATIRDLKNLAQRKVETPTYTEPKRPSLRSDDLLEAFESEVQRSDLVGGVQGPDPTRSATEPVGVLPAQASQEERMDAADTLDEFEAFLAEPSAGMGGPQPTKPIDERSSLFTASDVREPTLPAQRAPPQPIVPPPPPHTPAAHMQPRVEPTPKSAPQMNVPPTTKEPVSERASARPTAPKNAVPEPLEDITGHFDRLLATMGELNADLPAAAFASETADDSTQHQEQAPAQQPKRSDIQISRSPVPDVLPRPEHHEPYDGTWIEECENIGDVLDVLGQVKGSIEDVRTTVALFVIGFSEELAETIRTAQNSDELELMLRKALTATIDDAFERTATRFVHERESFAREAGIAADAFDESVMLAEEDARMRRESEERERVERERLDAVRRERERWEAEERVRQEIGERERVERERRESEERERVERERLDAVRRERARREAEERARNDAQARERLRIEASREEIERAELARLAIERLAQEHEANEPTRSVREERVQNTPTDERPMSGTELFASAKAVHDRAENESAEDVTLPIEHSEKRTPTIAGRISHLIETLHELITQGDYDEALRTLTEVRGLLARQIELKEHRSEQVIDERMADFELKALALDLEILKARE